MSFSLSDWQSLKCCQQCEENLRSQLPSTSKAGSWQNSRCKGQTKSCHQVCCGPTHRPAKACQGALEQKQLPQICLSSKTLCGQVWLLPVCTCPSHLVWWLQQGGVLPLDPGPGQSTQKKIWDSEPICNKNIEFKKILSVCQHWNWNLPSVAFCKAQTPLLTWFFQELSWKIISKLSGVIVLKNSGCGPLSSLTTVLHGMVGGSSLAACGKTGCSRSAALGSTETRCQKRNSWCLVFFEKRPLPQPTAVQVLLFFI